MGWNEGLLLLLLQAYEETSSGGKSNWDNSRWANGTTENLLDMIIAVEESGEAELQETQGTASKKTSILSG